MAVGLVFIHTHTQFSYLHFSVANWDVRWLVRRLVRRLVTTVITTTDIKVAQIKQSNYSVPVKGAVAPGKKIVKSLDDGKVLVVFVVSVGVFLSFRSFQLFWFGRFGRFGCFGRFGLFFCRFGLFFCRFGLFFGRFGLFFGRFGLFSRVSATLWFTMSGRSVGRSEITLLFSVFLCF